MWLFPVVTLLLLLLLPGCSAAQDPTGPNTVRGHEQGSLMVECRYASTWKTYKKYWCQGNDWSSCKTVVRTDSEQLVRKDRVSIRDNQRSLTFTVTMENLRRTDAGTYWCAIERIGADLRWEVHVIIDPATRNSTRMMMTTVTGLTSTPSTAQTTTSSQPVTQTSPLPRSLLNSVFFQVLVFLELPLLLGMLSAVIWVSRPQRCSEERLSGSGENQIPMSINALSREKHPAEKKEPCL